MTRKTNTPAIANLADLIRKTAKLRKDLQTLVRRFPEDHLNLGERVFVRLLNPVWRNEVGDLHGPYERKQTEAIAWIAQYREYLRDLEAYFCDVRLDPERHQLLPLNANRPEGLYQAVASQGTGAPDAGQRHLRKRL